MKKLAVALILISSYAHASPYFRLIDPSHPQFSAGALYSMRGFDQLQAVTDVALITHSTEDGSIIPETWRGWIAPESWTPLQIGGGYGNGQAVLNLGFSTNVLPEAAVLATRAIDFIGNPDALQGIRKVLTSKNGSMSVATGWTPSIDVIRDGTILPFNAWRVIGRLYSACAWRF